MLPGGLVGKLNKYQKVEIPKPKIIESAVAMNRKDKRKILFNDCSCGSDKKFKNCCFRKIGEGGSGEG